MRRLSRALVVGGAGFYGSWLVGALLAKGSDVTVLDSFAHGRPEDVAGAQTVVGDATVVDVKALIDEHGSEVVFQLAGTGLVPTSLEYPLADLTRNAATTLAVLEGARRARRPPVVGYVSSAAVYGEGRRMPMDEEHPLEPVSPYGISKLAAEGYIRLYQRLYGLETFAARPFSLYGPRQRKLVVYDLLRRLLEGEDPLVVAAPAEISRDFVYVEDAADALLVLARSAPAAGEAYNIASGRPTTLGELAHALAEASGTGATVEFTGRARAGDPLRWDGHAGRARALGARFDTPLEEGLARTAAWFIADSEETARADA